MPDAAGACGAMRTLVRVGATVLAAAFITALPAGLAAPQGRITVGVAGSLVRASLSGELATSHAARLFAA